MIENVAAPRVAVAQVISPGAPPTYEGAAWIGVIDEADVDPGPLALLGTQGYHRARLLVRSGRAPRGFVELSLVAGAIDQSEARAALAQLPPAVAPPAGLRPPITVVLCTYDRPAMLATALASVLALDYPDFEVVVVDNHPASGVLAAARPALADPRIRFIAEPRRGLARARNTGVAVARHDIVAFTDDDVVVDRAWLQGLADGFAADRDVVCVTGIVPGAEIDTESQSYFDRRVAWARRCRPEVFSLASVRESEPLFPFAVGAFGTGANFAMRREAVVALGGFDEALGVGTRSGGCEDLDMFVRVLLAGHQLAYEPAALVWHRHRADLDSLTVQIADYGRALGALIAKLAMNPRTLAMMIRRFVPALRRLQQVTNPGMHALQPAPAPRPGGSLWSVERRAVLSGPFALARDRLSGAKARPLSARR